MTREDLVAAFPGAPLLGEPTLIASARTTGEEFRKRVLDLYGSRLGLSLNNLSALHI
jgi:hypothetical protein